MLKREEIKQELREYCESQNLTFNEKLFYEVDQEGFYITGTALAICYLMRIYYPKKFKIDKSIKYNIYPKYIDNTKVKISFGQSIKQSQFPLKNQ